MFHALDMRAAWGCGLVECFLQWLTGATCCLGSRSLNVGAVLRSEAKRSEAMQKVPTHLGWDMDMSVSTTTLGTVDMEHVQTVRLSDCLVLLSDCSWNVGDSVPTAPCCCHLIFLLLHASSRRDPHPAHGKADSSAASGHCCNLLLRITNFSR